MIDAGTISIAEIAKRLGVSARTFYTYFPQARARSQACPKGCRDADPPGEPVLRSDRLGVAERPDPPRAGHGLI